MSPKNKPPEPTPQEIKRNKNGMEIGRSRRKRREARNRAVKGK